MTRRKGGLPIACLAVLLLAGPAGAQAVVASTDVPPQETAAPDPLIQPPAPPLSPTPPAIGGDADIIVVTAPRYAPAEDPLSAVNVQSFALAQSMDKAVVGPVALAYKGVVAEPVRNGIRNFLNNLHEPVVFLNFLVQLHPGRAAETFGRFAINSTVGVAGVFDMAKRRPFRLPRRPNGFANSLGYYGIRPGPFLFLPLVGPTTVRDALGGVVDRLLLPMAIGAPFNQPTYTIPAGGLSALDRRIAFDDELRDLRETAPDPYAARRNLYLRKRAIEIEALKTHRRPPGQARD